MDWVVSSSLRRQKALPGWIQSWFFVIDCSRNAGSPVLAVAGILWRVVGRILTLAQYGYWYWAIYDQEDSMPERENAGNSG